MFAQGCSSATLECAGPIETQARAHTCKHTPVHNKLQPVHNAHSAAAKLPRHTGHKA